MELPKENEINWLEFGNHNADGRFYIKTEGQWFEIWHTQGWVEGVNKVSKEKIEKEIEGIPAHLARNEYTRGWSAEWGKETMGELDSHGCFMIGDDPMGDREEEHKTSIKEILNHLGDFNDWLDSKYS